MFRQGRPTTILWLEIDGSNNDSKKEETTTGAATTASDHDVVIGDDKPHEKDSSKTATTGTPATQQVENSDNNRDDAKKQRVGPFLLNVYFALSYVFMAVGALLGLGIVLNLAGYGYQVTPNLELRIDTMGNMRREAQFRNEVIKSMKEQQQQQQQSRSVVVDEGDEMLRKSLPSAAALIEGDESAP